jgi:hypothetical protein
VVDVTTFTEWTGLDSHGSFHSDALHVVDRWTIVGVDRIDYEVTLEDRKVFTEEIHPRRQAQQRSRPDKHPRAPKGKA